MQLVPIAVARDIVRFTAIEMGKHEELFPKGWKRDYFSAQRWYWK